MSEFIITSAKWKARINAPTAMIAVVRALKRDKPKSLGALIMIEEKGKPESFLSAEAAIKLAGFIFAEAAK